MAQENIKSFQQVLTGSNISKGSKGMKNIKFSGKAGSADQEAMVEFFLKNLLNVIQEKGYVEEPFFNAGETGVFYKNVGKRTYVM